MKYFLLVFFILIYSFRSWSLSTHVGCILIKEKTQIYFTKEKTEYIPVNRNQILPYLEIDQAASLFKVSYLKKEYWIPSEKVITGGKHLCAVEPKCFIIRKPAQIFTEPNVTSKAIGDLERNSELDWFGQNYIIAKNEDLKSNKKVNWYQIKVGEQYGWVEASIGKLEDHYCDSSLYNKEKKWTFDFEFGSEAHITSSVYDVLMTSVSDPNDVACLQNPLVTRIDEGTGKRYGLNFDYIPWTWLLLRWGLHYEQLKFKLQGKDNPHPDPGKTSCVLIPKKLSELEDTSQWITENNLVMPFGSYFKYDLFRHHSFLMGGSINVVSNMLPHFTFNYYKGDTLSKQTLTKTKVGPTQMRYSNEWELRYLYRLPLTEEYSLGFSIYYRIDSNKTTMSGVAVHL